MTNFINTAETGLANNVDITTANSGSGSAGTAFTVTKGAGGTFKMDTAIKHRGAASYKMVCAVDGDSARADLILGAASNAAAVEGYFYLTAYPSAETSLLNLRSAAGSVAFININSTGQVLIGPVTGSPPHVGYTRQSVVEIDASSTSGTGTLTLVQQSGPTVSISGPVANVFRVILPNPMATAAVVRLTSTDGATSDFQDITITPTGGSTTVLARDFLVHNGTAYV
jgi:hypothetical protein